jgi:pimeloyl-ACP methyl ester carboxylesterase
MRNIYIGVAAFFLLCVTLFITSFIYLDKSRHDVYYYDIALKGHTVGTIRVDRFLTEDKLIYKSLNQTPFYPVYTESRSKLELNKKYALESYSKERYADRSMESMYIKNMNGLVSFVSTYRSRFSFAGDIPVKKDVFIFEDDSPMTYLPIIENYNFSRGRSQGFNAISCPGSQGDTDGIADALPPISRFVTLTSIRDEYLKIKSRKIKTENLVLKIRDCPGGAVWVAKSDRAIIKIELPAKGITITRSFAPKTLEAKKFTLQDPRYISKDISFKSQDAELAATVTIPTMEGPFPAALLLGGDDMADRDREGLFVSISDYLSKGGFVVMRFDRRGTGISKADGSSMTGEDEAKDAAAALNYLKGHSSVDPDNIFVLGHAAGALRALRLASEAGGVKGLILMAPADPDKWSREEASKDIDRWAESLKWPDSYRSLAKRSLESTADKVKESGGDWVTILGKRCYAGAMRQAPPKPIAEITQKIEIPVYIMQGKEDDDSAIKTAFEIDEALEASGNKKHSIKLFGYLGRFFGELVNDGKHRLYHDPDKAVMEHIKSWFDKTFTSPAKPPEAAVSTESAAVTGTLN